MLEFLSGLERVAELLVIVLGRVFLRLRGQFPDALFVFGDRMIQSFEAGLDSDHLVVPGRKFRRCLLLRCGWQLLKYLACFFQSGDVAVPHLVRLGPKLGHAFGQIALSRQHAFDLAQNAAAFLRMLLEYLGLLAEFAQTLVESFG